MPDANTSNSSELPKKIVDRLSRLRLGHEAVMLEDARELLAANRNQNNSHAALNGLKGADDMGNLILGDSVTHMHQKPSSPWKWVALAGAIATGGIGLLQAPAIIDALNGEPEPVEQTEFVDTNSQFELHLGRPPE